MVVGRAWDGATWLSHQVLAHEQAHAAQPLWRTRLADVWIKSMLVGTCVAAFLGWWPALVPWIGAGVALVGDAVWRWPLEADADRTAAAQVQSVAGDAPAVHTWVTRLVQRDRVALVLESFGWAAMVFVAGFLAASLLVPLRAL